MLQTAMTLANVPFSSVFITIC